MDGPNEIIKVVYKGMADVTALVSEILTVLDSYQVASLNLDSDGLDDHNQKLLSLFSQIESKLLDCDILLRRVGMKSDKPFKELASRLSGTAKQTFIDRLSEMENAVLKAKAALAHREVVIKAQLNVLDDVVGELQLEIHV